MNKRTHAYTCMRKHGVLRAVSVMYEYMPVVRHITLVKSMSITLRKSLMVSRQHDITILLRDNKQFVF